MSFVYTPTAFLEKTASPKQIKRLLGNNLSIKRTALRFADTIDILDKDKIIDVALKASKSYKARLADELITESAIKSDPKLLVQRVQREVIFQIKEGIKEKYSGDAYEWLPSDADEPDPEHQLNYGQIFKIGVGEMPGDRYGCHCGMRIITEDEKLEL